MSRAYVLAATLVLAAACAPESPRAPTLAAVGMSTSLAARYEGDKL
jgi:hypothetical protein